MPADHHPPAPLLLYARRWQLGRQVGVLVGCGGLWVVTPMRMYEVPARDGVQGMLWPLVPVVFAAFLPSVLGTAAEVPERCAARPGRLRAVTVGVVLLLAAGLVLFGVRDPAVAARNTVLLVGAALVAAWLLPAAAGWAPVVVAPILMWLVGTRPHGAVAPWALLLVPAHGTAAWLSWAVAVAALVVGTGGYVRWGPRGPGGGWG
ncbi:hypothetical protein [Streptomyces sp. NPDC058045]|uniref:hypothetical protein n=1 Tax=Streptomyces sp. NPDC058045 TaxID=3346311 RepID=UPI0036E77999